MIYLIEYYSRNISVKLLLNPYLYSMCIGKDVLTRRVSEAFFVFCSDGSRRIWRREANVIILLGNSGYYRKGVFYPSRKKTGCYGNLQFPLTYDGEKWHLLLSHWRYFDKMSSLPASKKGSAQKQPRKGGDIIFPIISQWGLSVAMDTRVLIQSASKHYAAFPPPAPQ